MTDQPTDALVEITAMKTVAEALSDLDTEARARVLAWASGRFAPGVASGGGGKRHTASPTADRGDGATFDSIADLHAAAAPNTDSDRALVAGYWYQFMEGQEDFASQTINTALKNLGHGVSNITKALEVLKAQSPALVLQVRKAGTTQQARKKYKLTAAGKKAVDQMIGQGA